MEKQGWFQQELKTVQETVKKWPKWKLGETEAESKNSESASRPTAKAKAAHKRH